MATLGTGILPALVILASHCLLRYTCASSLGAAEPVPSESRSLRRQLNSQSSSEAYVTLLYGEEYLLGVRVLGQSLRNSKTERDYVVLCTEDVSESNKLVLRSDGWIVKSVQSLANPYKGFPSFLVKVFTKLLIWTLTEYKKVIYIDSDAIVLRNIDHLFHCGNFCVAYRHSDLFNTGVLVLDPSQEVFNDMSNKLGVLGSYTGGDQGFLNVYFNEVKYTTMFNKNTSKPDEGYMRLPAGYNADVGIYYTVTEWRIPQEELMILHYTLGPVKPWKWWSYPLFELNWQWLSLRTMLPSSCSEACPSWNYMYMELLPLVIFGLFVISARVWSPYCYRVFEHRIVIQLCVFTNPINGWLASAYHINAVFGSWYLAFNMVPSTIWPVHGWVVHSMWFFFLLILFYFPYCHIAHVVGQRHGQQKLEHIFTIKQETFIWMFVSFTFYIIGICIVWAVSPFLACFKSIIVFVMLGLVFSNWVGGRLVSVWFGFKYMSC